MVAAGRWRACRARGLQLFKFSQNGVFIIFSRKTQHTTYV